jgi:hypothetical protein
MGCYGRDIFETIALGELEVRYYVIVLAAS